MIASSQPAFHIRTISLLAGFMLMVMSPFLMAQTTVRMKDTLQKDCVAVTDSAGLNLVPGSTDLSATGVSLSGPGCGSAGATANFQASVSAPGTATIGTPITVAWSASADATACTYGLPTSGVSGWPSGTSACSGAACAGSHNIGVTINTAGNYNFGITCTNGSGIAQSNQVSVIGPAPTPNGFALTAPSAALVNAAFSVSWTVQNATSCTGAASLGGSSVSLPGWTTVTSAVSPRSATPAAVGIYTLTLTCSNTSGSITSLQAQVNVSAGGGVCNGPAGYTRILTSDITYGAATPGTRANVSVLEWDNIWGHSSATDAVVAWPGIIGSSPNLKSFARTSFLSAHFKTPANATTASSKFGNFTYPTYTAGENADMSISTTCGDFSPPADTGCAVYNVASADQAMVAWWFKTTNASFCHLLPNTDYYLNIKRTDPQAATECPSGASICPLTMVSQGGGSF
ncbi:MAG: hypothetical protein ABIQ70_13080 [Dokdonella sp.]